MLFSMWYKRKTQAGTLDRAGTWESTEVKFIWRWGPGGKFPQCGLERAAYLHDNVLPPYYWLYSVASGAIFTITIFLGGKRNYVCDGSNRTRIWRGELRIYSFWRNFLQFASRKQRSLSSLNNVHLIPWCMQPLLRLKPQVWKTGWHEPCFQIWNLPTQVGKIFGLSLVMRKNYLERGWAR